MMTCLCGSGADFEACCGEFLARTKLPETAEQLMRSRYSAYVKQDIDYLYETLWPKYQPSFDRFATARWAAQNHWTGLSVLKAEAGQAKDRQGTVLFEARFLEGGALHSHRELSLFKKKSGRWYYVEALIEE